MERVNYKKIYKVLSETGTIEKALSINNCDKVEVIKMIEYLEYFYNDSTFKKSRSYFLSNNCSKIYVLFARVFSEYLLKQNLKEKEAIEYHLKTLK